MRRVPGEFGFAQSFRTSELMPERPRKPDSCSSMWWTFSSAAVGDFLDALPANFFARWKMIAGSIEPDRVPIGGPSSGVIPMDVSRHLPSRTAASEIPLPM